MIYRIPLTALLFVALLFSLNTVWALDQDYFTADQDAPTQLYLDTIEAAHTNLILGWIRDGRMDKAMADITYTLERFPNHPRGLMLAELAARITGVPLLPIPYYEKAITLYPQHALTQAQYGKYLVEIGSTDKGITKLKRALELDSKLPAAHVWMSEAYSKNGDHELARREAEQARALGYKGELLGEVQKNTRKLTK